MSIKIQIGDKEPERRPKIRVTLDGQPVTSPPPQLPAPQGEASVPQAEPIPARVLAFWNFDEDKHKARTPWALRRESERNPDP
jgi:hypothetical protein